ncbi:hypothetical protein RHSP_61189 [Rhizobium freirei PRF 81]|uniref:Uncharacterized protein n=1 Tax=Rhizobium freirei PRF 81 TaxID=363754 RepID=N6V5U1_9HYPH|nr:hypothetical protein RHSP_61189 [Rhizobium freirei PRF 81]
MRTRNHHAEGIKQEYRNDDADDAGNDAGKGGQIGDRTDAADLLAIKKEGEADAADDPEQREDRRVANRMALGAAIQRFQDAGRARPVTVVGGGKVRTSRSLGGAGRGSSRGCVARGAGIAGFIVLGLPNWLFRRFRHFSLRDIRRRTAARLQVLVTEIDLQSFVQCLKGLVLDRLDVLFVRHAVTPRYNSLGLAVSFPVIPPCPEKTNPASRGGLRLRPMPSLDFPLHFRVDNCFFKRML